MITSAAAATDTSSSNSSSPSPPPDPSPARHYRDVFWLTLFLLHLAALAAALTLLGVNRFNRADRLNIDRFNLTAAFNQTVPPDRGVDYLTETFWPMYGVAGAVGAALALGWLVGLGRWAGMMMRVSVHILTTYLAVACSSEFSQEKEEKAREVGAALQQPFSRRPSSSAPAVVVLVKA